MYKCILRKRILKGTVIALALFAVIPVTSAAAKPVSVGQPDPWLQSMLAQQRYEKQFGRTPAERGRDVLNVQALNREFRGQYAIQSPEITTGLGNPSQPQTVAVSTGSDFEWSNAWIGAGILAALLFGVAATLAVRSRHQGGLAH
ncbi:MAG TPA: hypothetical protein VLU96_08490 [Gaiellaceae bacterium]|nr:hypothetical protein [Gaiellaceae bacterium]